MKVADDKSLERFEMENFRAGWFIINASCFYTKTMEPPDRFVNSDFIHTTSHQSDPLASTNQSDFILQYFSLCKKSGPTLF